MRILALVSVFSVLAGCSALPEVNAGVCGNHVLEAGEACDEPSPGCGAPDTASACRFICSDSGACPLPGYACGLDHECRRPSGSYTLSAPTGRGGDRFGLVDLDRDGLPDVAARGNRDVTVYRNPGGTGGGWGAVASGPLVADQSVDRPIVVGRLAADDARPLLAVITLSTVDLYEITDDAQIAPAAIASVLLPSRASPPVFLGAVAFGDREPAEPIVYQPEDATLEVYQGEAQSPVVVAVVDLAACGARAGSVVEATLHPVPGGTALALLVDGKHACLVEARRVAGKPTLQAVPLRVDALPGLADADRLEDPVFADVDGDHTLDLIALVRRPLDAMAGSFDNHFVVWLRDASGGPPTGATVGMSYAPYFSYQPAIQFAAADFDGDGFDDLADGDVMMRNAHAPGTFAFTTLEEANDNIEYFGPGRAAGDVNRDGTPDLILTSLEDSSVTSCLSDGESPPGFTCFAGDTLLPALSSLVLGDWNGDLTTDIAALEDPTLHDVGENEIRFLQGRALSVPVPLPVPVRPYHAQAVGLARSGSRPDLMDHAPNPADELLVALRVEGAGLGLARGRPVDGAAPAFGVPVPTWDLDFTAGAAPMLRLLRCDEDPPGSQVNGDCKVQTYGGAPLATAFTRPTLQPFNRKFPAGLDAYGTNVHFVGVPEDPRAIVWSEPDGLVIAHLDAASGTYKTTLAPASGGLADITWTALVDADGAADPLGDRRDEVLVETVHDGHCRVLLGRFGRGAAAPIALVNVASVDDCVAGLGFNDGVQLGRGAPFFLLADGSDALARPRELVVTIATPDGAAHLAVFAPADDGSYAGEPIINPPRFRATAGANPEPLPDPAGHRWIATTDMNGDGIPDLVFRSVLGLVIAYADAESP